MKRREFLAVSVLGAATSVSALAQESKGNRLYFEFIRYQVTNNADRGKLEAYWENAAIPAFNRLGIRPIGVFRSKFGTHGLDLYALIPHPSLESFATAWERIAEDAAYQAAGAEFLNAPMDDPLYYRFETSLLHAFTHLPTLEIPKHIEGKNGRLYQVRIYESHSREKAKLKIEMFNKGGEIALFKETGLNPVMFGETLAGEKMPNLVYILGFENMQEHDKAWDTFRNSDGWANMKDLPRYKNTVSSVTDFILTPAGCSQM